MGLNLGDISGDHVINITDDILPLFNQITQEPKYNPYLNFEDFLLEANILFFKLPINIIEKLIKFRRDGNIEGAILIRGLPIDPNLPPTPLDSQKSPDKTTLISELWLTLFSTVFGEPFSYLQEKNGTLIQNLCPTNHNRDKLSSESSDILLDFHTEVAFHPHKPDYLFLFCLRQDVEKKAKTIVASIRKIYPLLTQEQKILLRQPLFETGIDYSFGSPNKKKGGGLVTPIIIGYDDDPLFCFDPDLMSGMTDEASSILPELNTICHENASYVYLQPGDLLIIDNRRSAHARTMFKAKFNGEDRWLQRMSITQDLEKSSSEGKFKNRVITTTF